PRLATRWTSSPGGPAPGAIPRPPAEAEHTERAERFLGHVRECLEDHPAPIFLARRDHVLLSAFFDQKEPRRTLHVTQRDFAQHPADWMILVLFSIRKKDNTIPFDHDDTPFLAG